MVASQGPRCPSGQILNLPNELQLRVLEGLSGPDLARVEATCRDFRQLVASEESLYQQALSREFNAPSAPSPDSSKAQYVQTFVQARLDVLEKQRCVYNSLKLRVEELDDLLEQADDVKELLGGPDFEPSMVLALVGDMEQDVLQQRWDASEDLLAAEAKMQSLQDEVVALLARVPRCWRSASLQLAAGGCTIA
ncbi:hypothetical protein GPECTOR_23g134 [Gonium pectorale]|uniref:F-box domain-containing protein n=1 Tax=Gonium pectorale TaxID=33097 RepID=A0A150GGT3_GONPE|nr:hypothetical protein GPECTOR_23g134 [Gonium pectorale]|eukprot:KXZ49048.1 hypothetical protein GPECTOR_23g134 [Gonium pectorale]